jgi:4-oxalocrotonate tautomerase
MPEIVVYLIEGRTPEQKKGLMQDITTAVVKNCGVDPGAVVVSLVETARINKSKAGVPFSERK